MRSSDGLNIVSCPLLMAMLPMSFMKAAGLSAGLIVVYILFGGFWGASLVGLFKTLLICGSLGVAGIMSYQMSGGFMGLTQQRPIFCLAYPFSGRSRQRISIHLFSGEWFCLNPNLHAGNSSGKDMPSSKKGVFVSLILAGPI